MDSENKCFEIQLGARRNAREYQDSVKDLYSWEKDIKDKELAMKNAPAPTITTNTTTVRSHVTQNNEKESQQSKQKVTHGSPGGSAASTPTEKQDLPQDMLAQQHKKANDIKDRGNNYVKQMDYQRAIEAYTEAINVYPLDPVYFINRALCHLKVERYENCVEDCEAAIELDSLCVKAYYRRMQANESLGNNMEALKDCTTVLTLDPKNAEAKRSLERINERLRRNATKDGPNFCPARDNLVDILPFDKPAYKRSKKPMRRVPVVDIVSPRCNRDAGKPLNISDEEIDKIFNSNCGVFEEIKKNTKRKSSIPDTIKNVEDKAAETKAKPQEKPSAAKVTPINDGNQDEIPAKDVPQQKQASATPASEVSVKKLVESKPETDEKSASDLPTQEAVKTNLKPTNSKQNEPTAPAKQAKPSEVERVPPSPAGTAQFYITWKELSPTQKFHYLKSIEVGKLCKILGAGFDSDTFTDLLSTLKDFYVPNKEPTTAAVLLEIAKNDEFTILAMLMSEDEKKMVKLIMDGIKKFPKNNQALLTKIGKAYNII